MNMKMIWCWALPALMAMQLAHAAPGVTLVDDRGVTVRLDASPARIVTLLPSLTETVCELGGCSRLVGTDRYSNHPASVRSLPKTGGLDDANIELIASLKPDVVLLALSSRVTDRLESLGIKVVALEPRTYKDVQRVATKVAQILGSADGGLRLWQRLEAQVDAAAKMVPASSRGLSVYYEVDSAPYAAGESSFIGETLTRLGARNIVPTSLGPFPKLNPEYVVRADPHVIMISQRHSAAVGARPGWDRIRAVRDKRVCAFTSEQGDVLSRPGPRMGEAAQIMARCLRDAVTAAAAASGVAR
ncbi:MAG: helical backbone metal receptor [Aquabacterium sp.]|nr:helical backbone metal receptor [Aquabacterium sp.]MDO9006444.1 helical backbone metal receptor [Aquabacterium sp.]